MVGPDGATTPGDEPGSIAPSLAGREWTLRAVAGTAVSTLRPPTLRFEDDGRITGSTGVNRMFGGYAITDGRLQVTGAGSTRMAGPPEAMATEATVLRVLTAGGPIVVAADGVLTIGEGDDTLTFDATTAHSILAIVTFSERLAMPQGAALTVTLADVSLADAPADVVATAHVAQPGNLSIEVVLPYDPARIDERHAYAVRAAVDVDGELVWTSTEACNVLTRGAPDRVALVLSPVDG